MDYGVAVKKETRPRFLRAKLKLFQVIAFCLSMPPSLSALVPRRRGVFPGPAVAGRGCMASLSPACHAIFTPQVYPRRTLSCLCRLPEDTPLPPSLGARSCWMHPAPQQHAAHVGYVNGEIWFVLLFQRARIHHQMSGYACLRAKSLQWGTEGVKAG